MAIVKCKGTILQQEISSNYTAVAQLDSVSYEGGASSTFDMTTLDTSGAGRQHSQTGYADSGSVSFSGLYDPALAGHQAITDLITTPAAQNWKIIFADAGASVMTLSGAGVSFDITAAMDDGLKFSSSITCTGLPVFTT